MATGGGFQVIAGNIHHAREQAEFARPILGIWWPVLPRKDSPGRPEVAQTKQEVDLVGLRPQRYQNLIQPVRDVKVALALGTVEDWWRFERIPFGCGEDLHLSHTLVRFPFLLRPSKPPDTVGELLPVGKDNREQPKNQESVGQLM